MNRKFIIPLLVAFCVTGVVAGCRDSKTGAQPSAMITDEAMMQKFGSEALPKNYHVLSRVTRWHVDGVQQHFERSYEATVLEMDNKDVDPKIVSDSLEAWLAKQVKVTSNATDTGADRVIRYTTGQISGELHYTIKPVPDATLTVSGESSRAHFQSLDIQIVEQGIK